MQYSNFNIRIEFKVKRSSKSKIQILNFDKYMSLSTGDYKTDDKKEITLDKNYKNMLNDEIMSGKYTLEDCGFYILTDV